MYPKYVEVNGRKYKINTDFRVAIECNRIAEDNTIGDFERILGIICTLYEDKALDNPEDYEELLKVAKKYLSCGEELDIEHNKEPDMDFIEDEKYIKSSFKYDYNYNPYDMKYLHWWEFYNDLNNLSNSELGDCCILNRIRNLRNCDTSKIKDVKERDKIEKAKKQVSLKKYRKENNLTKEQEKSMEELNKLLGL